MPDFGDRIIELSNDLVWSDAFKSNDGLGPRAGLLSTDTFFSYSMAFWPWSF